jgi:hypothetical protein
LSGSPTLSTSTSYVLTNNLVAGASYYFRVQAVNKYGAGLVSEDFLIKASTKPSKMATPTVSIIAFSTSEGGIQISWLPAVNNFETVTVYEIGIKNAVGDYVVQSSCLGSSQVIINALTCKIKTADLRTSHNLNF